MELTLTVESTHRRDNIATAPFGPMIWIRYSAKLFEYVAKNIEIDSISLSFLRFEAQAILTINDSIKILHAEEDND
jgi:hypothetical protein